MRLSPEDAARRKQLDDAFVRGRGLQSEGKLDEAARIYEQILLRFPQHADSLTLLASISYQRGDDIQGEAYVERAIEAQRYIIGRLPDRPTARAPLANLLLARGRQAEAEEICKNLDLPLNVLRMDRQTFLDRRNAAMLAGVPPMLIATLPKSASESIWNRLAEGLRLPQSHISIGLFPDCCILGPRASGFGQGGVISKEHVAASAHNLEMLRLGGIRRVLVHLRDPRQAAVSWAHFVKTDVAMRLLAPIWRKIVPPASVLAQGGGGDLEAVIDWSLEHYLPLQIDWVTSWVDAEAAAGGPEILFLDFEGFKRDPDDYLAQVLRFFRMAPEAFSEDKSAAAEVVHLRRGETDEWRRALSARQQARALETMTPALCQRFGWSG
ncbi:MAG: hypothetical protein GDA47_00010 [Rhodospirillales bacterium]|nr:hypothetical protein [Rhodospirillales bacterium]